MANELRRGAYVVCKPEGKDRMYTESDLKAAEAAAMAKAADIFMQKHYADFYIGVSRAREIVLNCCTSDQRSALAEHDAALLKELGELRMSPFSVARVQIAIKVRPDSPMEYFSVELPVSGSPVKVRDGVHARLLGMQFRDEGVEVKPNGR